MFLLVQNIFLFIYSVQKHQLGPPYGPVAGNFLFRFFKNADKILASSSLWVHLNATSCWAIVFLLRKYIVEW